MVHSSSPFEEQEPHCLGVARVGGCNQCGGSLGNFKIRRRLWSERLRDDHAISPNTPPRCGAARLFVVEPSALAAGGKTTGPLVWQRLGAPFWQATLQHRRRRRGEILHKET